MIILILGLLYSACTPSAERSPSPTQNEDKVKIHKLHQDYVTGWNQMDEAKIMNLLEPQARIQPNRLSPIEGKEKIREFWFPKDSSVTTINQYETDIISLELLDTIAIMTFRSTLDWDYQKDSLSFGMLQKGINTTIFRQQSDRSWKIWRSMWTDIAATQK